MKTKEKYIAPELTVVTFKVEQGFNASGNGMQSLISLGPVLPGGEIGANNGNQTVGYASEMHFALKDNGTDGKTITSGSSISFVVPVTITPIKRIVVTGYGTDGTQLFVKDKELPLVQTIQANHMYNIPEINF